MPTKQLYCRDLKRGDVLLKASDNSWISNYIKKKQTKAGHANPHVIHAGIMYDSVYIIEAQSKGISANDLRVQNKNFGYWVFHATDAVFADAAGAVFPRSAAKVPSSILAQHLRSSGHFQEEGDLLPGAR